jgi:hypothetical protein
MKKKELKELAKKIAKCEYIIQTSSDKKEIMIAQDEIFNLSSRVDSFEDISIIDDMVQELLEKLLDK